MNRRRNLPTTGSLRRWKRMNEIDPSPENRDPVPVNRDPSPTSERKKERMRQCERDRIKKEEERVARMRKS